MSALLSANDLTFSYTEHPVLRGVRVQLGAGEVVALLGPNGSGKSTLIKVLLGHLHGRGTIAWSERPISRWSRRQLARHVAYLPQAPSYDPGHRVADVLRLGRAPYWSAFGIESSRDLNVVQEVARTLELSDLMERYMSDLSGGQRQRVFLGRCLTQEPAALLLDEPNTFLDLKHQIELTRLLSKLSRDRQIGVLMASHDLNLSAALADRVILLKDGAVVRDGTPEQVMEPDVIGQVYGVAMQRIERDGRPLVFPMI